VQGVSISAPPSDHESEPNGPGCGTAVFARMSVELR